MDAIIYILLYFIGVIITNICNEIFLKDLVITWFESDRMMKYNQYKEEHRNMLKRYYSGLSLAWPVYLFILMIIKGFKLVSFVLKYIFKTTLTFVVFLTDFSLFKIKEKINRK